MSTRICRFLPLISLPASNPSRVDPGPPFSALFTLWLSMMQAVGLASHSALSRESDVQCMMDPVQRPVAMPPRKMDHATCCRWGDPLDICRHRLAGLCLYITPFMTARMSTRRSPPPCLRGRDRWLDICPLVISQVISDTSSDRGCTSPGSCPSTMEAPPRIKIAFLESQPIRTI